MWNMLFTSSDKVTKVISNACSQCIRVQCSMILFKPQLEETN